MQGFDEFYRNQMHYHHLTRQALLLNTLIYPLNTKKWLDFTGNLPYFLKHHWHQYCSLRAHGELFCFKIVIITVCVTTNKFVFSIPAGYIALVKRFWLASLVSVLTRFAIGWMNSAAHRSVLFIVANLDKQPTLNLRKFLMTRFLLLKMQE